MALWLDWILHIDRHLAILLHSYGQGFYALVFAVVFVETGLVIMPFLPGDSLIFTSAALAGAGMLQIKLLMLVLFTAAVCGDNLNYLFGRLLGQRLVEKPHRWLQLDHIRQTEAFFEQYGKRAIIMARFLPIVRTFMPFVAGMGRMSYNRFLPFDLIGGLSWVGIMSALGYYFGNLTWVRHYFSMCIVGIIILSLLPTIIKLWQHRRTRTPPQNHFS